MKPAICLALTIFFSPTLSRAADVAASPNVDVGAELLRITLVLIGIVVLILASGWLMRQMQMFSRPSKRRLLCLESIAVGVKERILLLQIGPTQMVIGVAPGSIRTLHILPQALPEISAEPSSKNSFQHLLSTSENKPGTEQ